MATYIGMEGINKGRNTYRFISEISENSQNPLEVDIEMNLSSPQRNKTHVFLDNRKGNNETHVLVDNRK